ncbi:MAG: hypothetical protein P4N60_12245 [Verrucomicrobiae bacterium]|nr:hypothetical protein [Verrucomicrobiae bacterium]
MELKIICQCGQKYKFDVEPVGGRMPFAVNCPVCQADGTATANMRLAEHFRFVPPPPSPNPPSSFAPSGSAAPAMPPPPPPVGGLRINREVQAAPAPVAAPVVGMGGGTPPPIGVIKPLSANKKSKPKVEGEFSLVRGIIGAVVGSAIGCALLYAFWIWAQFRFPLMGIAVGVAGGYTARWLARGTDTTLGVITAVIACASVTGTFVLMYDGFPIFNIVSVVICASVAYRVTSE